MTRPLSEVLADVSAAVAWCDREADRAATLMHANERGLRDCARIFRECRDLLAEHNGPTWEPSSSVLLTLAQAERVERLVHAGLLALGLFPGGENDNADRAAVDALRHGIEMSKIRVEEVPS